MAAHVRRTTDRLNEGLEDVYRQPGLTFIQTSKNQACQPRAISKGGVRICGGVVPFAFKGNVRLGNGFAAPRCGKGGSA
jgi:hypothetical protein